MNWKEIYKCWREKILRNKKAEKIERDINMKDEYFYCEREDYFLANGIKTEDWED